MHTARALWLLFLLGPGVSAVRASEPVLYKQQAHFQVRITMTVLPTVCATRAGQVHRSSAHVVCLSNGVPSFNVPGRPEVITVKLNSRQQESTGRVLGAPAPEQTDTDARTLDAASLMAPDSTPPLEEIEVSF